MAQVVDYSFARPSPASIAQAGYVGAVRYLRGRGKAIDKAELAALHAAGLAVGFVEETTADRAGKGFDAGHLDAVAANQAADALGVPSMVPLRYAVDFQATWGQVRDYFAGARSAGGRPVSVYGCYDVIEGAAGEGYGWLWQCAAWSGNGSGTGGSIQNRRVSQHTVLFQRVGYVLGDTSDVNDVLADDWGGWHPDRVNTPATAPTPARPEEDDMQALAIARHENTTTKWLCQTTNGKLSAKIAPFLSMEQYRELTDPGKPYAGLPDLGDQGYNLDFLPQIGVQVISQQMDTAAIVDQIVAGVTTDQAKAVADEIFARIGKA